MANALTYGRRSQAQLTNGMNIQYGQASDMGLQWQSTGVLYKGCESIVNINNCYDLQLTNNASQQLDPGFPDSPRQRIEFLTPYQADGSTFTYTWKYYLYPSTGTTTRFFHLMQILTKGGSGGPVVTLDAVKNQVSVADVVRQCTNPSCPSVALSKFEGQTTFHSMTVTFGPSGKVAYSVTDASGGSLLSYQASGSMGSGQTTIKIGTYRAAVSGMTASRAALGDFTSKAG